MSLTLAWIDVSLYTCVRVPDTARVHPCDRRQSLRCPARVERGLHVGCEPGPLRIGQPPGISEGGEELPDPGVYGHSCRWPRLVALRGGGSLVVPWWIG
jgi:hypothetical protein